MNEVVERYKQLKVELKDRDNMTVAEAKAKAKELSEIVIALREKHGHLKSVVTWDKPLRDHEVSVKVTVEQREKIKAAGMTEADALKAALEQFLDDKSE